MSGVQMEFCPKKIKKIKVAFIELTVDVFYLWLVNVKRV